MPPNRLQSSLMKPLVALAVPGMYLVYKYNQFKRQQQENARRKVTEKELLHLNHKIDKLLAKLDEHETDTPPPIMEEEEKNCVIGAVPDECVVCLSAKATMQTFPCGHKVVCRKCFVKTIQVAVSQRCLPLKCVVCRSRILKLKQAAEDTFTPPASRKHGSPQRQASGSKQSKASSLARQLFSSSRPPQPLHQQQQQQQQQQSQQQAGQTSRREQPSQPVVATKLMQPWLIYPSHTDPKQQRAFLHDHAQLDSAGSDFMSSSPKSSHRPQLSQHHHHPQAGPFSPAQRRPRHQCTHSTRLAELKHAHMLSPRVPRCAKCSPLAGRLPPTPPPPGPVPPPTTKSRPGRRTLDQGV